MKVRDEVKDAIMEVLQESDGEPMAFRVLIRKAREKNALVSYCLSLHSEAIEQLSEDGFALRRRGRHGIEVKLGPFPYAKKGPGCAV
jgi:hypothetical protein